VGTARGRRQREPLRSNEMFFNVVAYGEKTDEKSSSRVANILSWIVAALLGAASAVVIALLVWNGFLYLEYLRQPPLARPFSHGSFALVGDDDDWTFKPQFPENAAVSFGSSGASATRYDRSDICAMAWQKAPGDIFRKIGRPSRRSRQDLRHRRQRSANAEITTSESGHRARPDPPQTFW